MDNIFISTTETLQGYSIETPLGLIVVSSAGAGNVIKDWLAGFTDFFGGKSKGYEATLDELISKGLTQMTQQAQQCGANAIVGFDLKITNLSKGKSLLAIILYGTAVIIKKD
ncbi:MAG: YbjQ family protein [Deltaproteobacteria bacterium]|nr:YbjQ family protein [Deltaproteobacteria bacterium]